LKLQARAKVNLTLEVLGKRTDGYHEIASVMQALALHDTLTIEPSDDLSLVSNWPEMESADNLVLRAARLLQRTVQIGQGARFRLEKEIPLAAGLGGGSSDAAAALRGLNELWGSHLSLSELADLGGSIGSDVPFFIYDGTALTEGRGDRVTPLPPLPKHWVVLVVPEVDIVHKTKHLYGLLSTDDYTSGAATRAVAAALRSGVPPDRELFMNVFQRVAIERFPQVRLWRDRMCQLGADTVWLAGSGPTLYTLLAEEEPARRLGRSLEAEGGQVYVTWTV